MTIKEIARKARSIRRFDNSQRIEHDTIVDIIDTARYAPSARNGQTHKFIAITDCATCSRVFPALKWAGYLTDWDGPSPTEQPTAYIAVLHDKTLGAYNAIDTGLAAQCIIMAAAEQGIGACILAAINRHSLAQTLSIDTERFDMPIIIALGIPAETVVIDDIAEGNIRYWRADDDTHHVPKRTTKELIIE